MKIRITDYYETFEREYETSDRMCLACIFEYAFQLKEELIQKLEREKNPMKLEIIKSKIVHIRELLEYYKDINCFLHEEETAL